MKVRPFYPIFLLSALGFFLELWNVRFIGTAVGELAYYSNLLLLAGILGFCAGLLIKPGNSQQLGRRLAEMAIALLLLHLATLYFSRGDLTSKEANEFFWFRVANIRPKGNPRDLTMAGFVLCVLTTLTLIPVGRLISWEFEKLKETRLQAYLSNILGGILGSVWFCALLGIWGTPWVLFGGFAILLVGFMVFSDFKAQKFAMTVGAVFLLATGILDTAYGWKYMWSPYYRVSLIPQELKLESRREPMITDYYIQSNHFLISGFAAVPPQELRNIYDTLPPWAASDRASLSASLNAIYEYFPYQVARQRGVKNLLMLGTCAGNELGNLLLTVPIEKATAVEIDPVFVRLGKTREVKRAYDDPRVKLVVGDARQFIQSTREQYDMVYFAFLDSQTTASNLSRFRLDSFVFTVESMRRMLDITKPGGLLCIAFCSAETWIASRFYQNLTIANGGIPPRVVRDQGCGFIFFTEKGRPLPYFPIATGPLTDVSFAMASWVDPKLKPSTDDWPFLYLHSPQLPTEYVKFMLIFALFGALLVSLCSGREHLRITGPNEMFFALMGFGFFLLEVRTISVSAVAWGVTLYAQAGALVMFTFASFLGSALYFKKPHWNVHLFWLLLGLSLVANYVFGIHHLAHLTGLLQKLSLVLLALPMVFSGFLYAKYFAQYHSPQNALAWNVVGGIAGGLAESLALLVGFRALVLVAIAAYALAYILSLPWQRLWSHAPQEAVATPVTPIPVAVETPAQTI